MDKLVEAKERLIKYYIRSGILKSEEVIKAFKKVPREVFVLPEYINQAYSDVPLPIGYGQTISAPHMVCMYAEYLRLKPGLKVLEIGAGSGYNAAVMAEMVSPSHLPREKWGHVYSLEIVPELCEFARVNLRRAGYDDRVTVICRDGGLGFPEKAPFDRIAITAAAPNIPPPLIEQLSDKGVLLIPLGSSFFQRLVLVKKVKREIVRDELSSVAFVPLKGKYGWTMT